MEGHQVPGRITWTLQSRDLGTSGVTFRLLPGTVKTLGRAAGADFVLDAPLVSRLHCRFALSVEGALTVEDLGSTNGTLVNDLNVQHARLVGGDRVRVGRVELVATEEHATAKDHGSSGNSEPTDDD